MKVFLTGNRGRIGLVVERQLHEGGHQVVGFDIATGDDILDAEAVERAMVDCDGVAHLAMLMGREHPRDQVFAAARSALGTCWMRLKGTALNASYPTAA